MPGEEGPPPYEVLAALVASLRGELTEAVAALEQARAELARAAMNRVAAAGAVPGWWRVPQNGQLFEVQFHTQASFEAKEQTHAAYERLRTLPPDHEEVRELRAYQRDVTAKIPIPPEAPDILVPRSE